MEVTEKQHRLLQLCEIRLDRESVDWSVIARQAQDPTGRDDHWQGIVTGKSAAAKRSVPRPPGKDTFPRRNVVTSGISQGTVVIEASSTSGAKMQARLAVIARVRQATGQQTQLTFATL
jgi:DNA recombination-mediator protein A